MDIIGSLSTYLKTVSEAIAAGKDVTPYAVNLYEILIKKREVTQDELDKLATESDAISDEIQKA